MPEAPSDIPKRIRKPVLDAGRTGNTVLVRNVLAGITDLRVLKGLLVLAEGEWQKSVRGDILTTRLKTRIAAIEASGIQVGGVSSGGSTGSSEVKAAGAEIIVPAQESKIIQPSRPANPGRGASTPLPMDPPDFATWMEE